MLKTLSPGDIAERWGCKVDKPLSLIASGELPAINIATNRNGGKPRWRITPEALSDFERSRTTQPKPAPVTRKKRTATPAQSYFNA